MNLDFLICILILPDNYPFVAPKFKFLTKIFHANIDPYNGILPDHMYRYFIWAPNCRIKSFLIEIIKNPNFYHFGCCNHYSLLTEECINNKNYYNLVARYWTEKYAIGNIKYEQMN